MNSYQGPNLAGLLKARWPSRPLSKAQTKRVAAVLRALKRVAVGK